MPKVTFPCFHESDPEKSRDLEGGPGIAYLRADSSMLLPPKSLTNHEGSSASAANVLHSM